MGWARDEDEEALVVPKGRYFSMAEVSYRLRGVTTRHLSWRQGLNMAVTMSKTSANPGEYLICAS